MTDNRLDGLFDLCRLYMGGDLDSDLLTASREFMLAAPEDETLVATVAAGLSSLPPHGAAWLAACLGNLAERGGNPGPSCAAVTDVLRFGLEILPEPLLTPDGDDEGKVRSIVLTEEQHTVVEAMPMLCQAAVALLARTPALRIPLSQDQDLIARLESAEDFTYGATWVLEALRRRDGTLLVLHTESGRGFRLRYQNVNLCFHLFSLIQAAIGPRLPGGKEPDPEVVASATGLRDANVRDEAWWHYGDPRSPEPHLPASIWGEAPADSIPRLEDEQVVLLWPMILGRRIWDSNFFGPRLEAMPPNASIEAELAPEEVARRLKALGIEPPRAKKSWWPF